MDEPEFNQLLQQVGVLFSKWGFVEFNYNSGKCGYSPAATYEFAKI